MLTNYILVSIICLQVLILESDCQCSHGDVQLVDGRGEYMGNVQVCVNGTWGYVCDNNWGTNDATVVCRQLGYSTTNIKSFYYGHGNGSIWLDRVECTGMESSLIHCATGVPIGYTNCRYNNMAGVFCSEGGPDCVHGDIRLSVPSYIGQSEGSLEVCYNGQWGTVCSDGWDSVDATVACKQLGYDGAISYYNANKYGSIKLTNVDCSSSDTSLLSCSYSTDTSDCGSYIASIRCYSTDTSSCSSGSIKLWSSLDSTLDNEGIVLVCRDDGTWYPMRDGSSCRAYEIACTTAGYTQLDYYINAARYGNYYHSSYRYTCLNDHKTLSQCTDDAYSISQYYNAVGVKCSTILTDMSKCTSGDVRLVGGSSEAEGRVEYCYNDIWSPMCSLNRYTAKLICEKFGYQKWSLIVNDGRYGRSNVSSEFSSLYCNSAHTSLSQCSVSTFSCTTVCSYQYGLKCFGPTSNECSDGDVRLVNGAIEQEGNVEVCVDGTWGAICGYGWSVNDAYVACVTLGYDGIIDPIAYTSMRFGLVTGPFVWSNVNCQHWNIDIHHCSKTEYPDFNSISTSVAGVRCTEDCTDGEVRLVGSNSIDKGTVEVCYEGLWGLVSDNEWDNNDALVVCNQLLGHTDGVPISKVGSFYDKPKKTIHLTSVICSGDEHTLTECTSTQLSVLEGKLLLPDTEVAGVDCTGMTSNAPPCFTSHDVVSSKTCNTKGSVRLIHNGIESISEGRVEYCTGQYWTLLCTMDNRAAAVTCRQLGHTQYQWGAVYMDGRYGNSMNYSLVQDILCSGSELAVDECTSNELSSDSCLPWCPMSNIGLRCFEPGECTDGSVRLSNGLIEQEGRVDVCVNGVWGSVCGEGWDQTDAHVVCGQLGYPEGEPVLLHSSIIDRGIYPIVYSNAACHPWDNGLAECEKDNYMSLSCPTGNVAGIFCLDGHDCTDGDVRLSMTSEGTVQVCFNKIWGLISENGWTISDAQVVCNQLGYTTDPDMIIARVDSYYGKPNKTVHLSGVQCNGEETRISECVYTKYSLEDGRTIPDAVAGVRCASATKTTTTTTTTTATTTTTSTTSETLNSSNNLSGSVGALGGVIAVLLLIILAIVVAVVILYRRVILTKQGSVANTDTAMQPVNHGDPHLPPPPQARVSNQQYTGGSKKGIAGDGFTKTHKAAEYSELNIRTCDDESVYESICRIND